MGIVVLCVSAGSIFISPFRVPEIISGGAGSVEYRILVDLRIPRILMALVVGASLSVSGVLFQSVLKNPLADPYTTGVSGGAAVGATVAIAFSMSYFLVALLAFGGEPSRGVLRICGIEIPGTERYRPGACGYCPERPPFVGGAPCVCLQQGGVRAQGAPVAYGGTSQSRSTGW